MVKSCHSAAGSMLLGILFMLIGPTLGKRAATLKYKLISPQIVGNQQKDAVNDAVESEGEMALVGEDAIDMDEMAADDTEADAALTESEDAEDMDDEVSEDATESQDTDMDEMAAEDTEDGTALTESLSKAEDMNAVTDEVSEDAMESEETTQGEDAIQSQDEKALVGEDAIAMEEMADDPLVDALADFEEDKSFIEEMDGNFNDQEMALDDAAESQVASQKETALMEKPNKTKLLAEVRKLKDNYVKAKAEYDSYKQKLSNTTVYMRFRAYRSKFAAARSNFWKASRMLASARKKFEAAKRKAGSLKVVAVREYNKYKVARQKAAKLEANVKKLHGKKASLKLTYNAAAKEYKTARTAFWKKWGSGGGGKFSSERWKTYRAWKSAERAAQAAKTASLRKW